MLQFIRRISLCVVMALLSCNAPSRLTFKPKEDGRLIIIENAKVFISFNGSSLGIIYINGVPVDYMINDGILYIIRRNHDKKIRNATQY